MSSVRLRRGRWRGRPVHREMSFKEKTEDVRNFLDKLDSFTDGQVEVVDMDWDTLDHILLKIKPNDGPYRGGQYEFKVKPGSSTVETTKILFHPNISSTGQICFSLDGSSYCLETTVLGLLYILHSPNYDAPYTCYKVVAQGNHYRTIRLALTGRRVSGAEICPKYIEDDEEILQFLREVEEEEVSRQRQKAMENSIKDVSEVGAAATASDPAALAAKEMERNNGTEEGARYIEQDEGNLQFRRETEEVKIETLGNEHAMVNGIDNVSEVGVGAGAAALGPVTSAAKGVEREKGQKEGLEKKKTESDDDDDDDDDDIFMCGLLD